jgi:SAM-dependent methyltransferase
MHEESLRMMTEMLTSLGLERALVLDVGSEASMGSFQPLVDSLGWEYLGLDIMPGPGVDIVTDHPYEYPFDDGTFDVVISGSTMEHVQALWLWVPELYRVLKDGGYLAICTVMSWELHRNPLDCWRILPDGMAYLLHRAGFRYFKIDTVGDKDIRALARKAEEIQCPDSLSTL